MQIGNMMRKRFTSIYKNRKARTPKRILAAALAAAVLLSGAPSISSLAAGTGIQTDASIQEILGSTQLSGTTILGAEGSTGTPSLIYGDGVSAETAREDAMQYAASLEEEAGSAAEETGTVSAADDPWQDSEVYGVLTQDQTVSKKDDFYAAVNRDFILGASVSETSPEDSVASRMSDAVTEKKKALLADSTLEGHDAETVQNMYNLLLDWETRNSQGIAPIMPFVAAIQQIQTLDDLTQYLCTDAMCLVDAGIAQLSISQYQNNPDYYAVEVDPTVLLLGTSEYSRISSSGKRQLSFLQSQCYYMLERIGYSEEQIDQIFTNCILFESVLAEAVTEYLQTEDVSTIGNKPCTEEDLCKLAGNFPMEELLQARGLDGSVVYNVPSPMWLVVLGKIYNEYNLEYFRDYLLVHTAISAMELTDSEAFNVRTALSVRFLGGTDAAGGDVNVAYSYVEALLGRVLDNVYIENCCSEKTKERVTELTEEILDAYRKMLDYTWLSDSAKEEALKKLDTMTIRVDYPDELPYFGDLSIQGKEEGGTLIGAYKTILTYTERKYSSLVNQKVSGDTWLISSGTVNCYYTPADNSINILDGMLQEPYYSDSYSNEELLGGIGLVIAHEITHAFDLVGSSYDAEGNLRNWWTDADEQIALQRWNRLADYYSSFEPIEGAGNVPGEQVADEAIADIGGMQCILRIADLYPAFDYDAFFTKAASCWAALRTEDAEYLTMQIDTHPLGYLRVNVLLQQFQQFYDTYDIQEGDGMYLAPGDRITFW